MSADCSDGRQNIVTECQVYILVVDWRPSWGHVHIVPDQTQDHSNEMCVAVRASNEPSRRL